MTAPASISARFPRPRRSARAFTLMELLVVIGIFVLLLAVAVPAFASLLYSQERSQAENQLAVAMGAARATAIATEGLGDAAAVVFYEPGGRTRISIYQEVGQIDDMDASGKIVKRDVFVPATGIQPLMLPRGWMIRAFAPPGSIDDGTPGRINGWYEPNPGRKYSPITGNWVFPETGFYDQNRTDTNAGLQRQSFMVRFEAGTGLLNMSSRVPALVIDPSPSSTFRTGQSPWKDFPSLLRADDPAGYVKRLLAKRRDLTDANRRLLFGDLSPDTVLCRPVTELALYDERSLAAGLKARGLNAATESIYGDSKLPMGIPTTPTYDPRLFANMDSAKLSDSINAWIQGTSPDGSSSDARIFTIDRYLGSAREVTP